MKATDFVKKFELSEFKELYLASLCVDLFRPPNDKIIGIKKSEIKELFEAFELVERFGDLRQAKLNLEHMISHNQFDFCATNIDELQNAINLVEQCQK